LRRVRWLANFFLDSPAHVLYRALSASALTTITTPRQTRLSFNHAVAPSPQSKREIIRGEEKERWHYYQRLAQKTAGLIICFTPRLSTAARWRHLFSRAVLLHRRLPARSWKTRWLRLCTHPAGTVLLTTRSGILLPLPQPALVILDEWESDQYKEEELRPFFDVREVILRYWARYTAVTLGESEKGLRTLFLARRGWKIKKLGRRVRRSVQLNILSSRAASFSSSPHPLLTPEILKMCRQYKRILFVLNRRGISARFRCPDCGLRWHCAKCGGNLAQRTEKRQSILACTSCGNRVRAALLRPVFCPRCQSPRFGPAHWGIDSLARALRRWQADFPVFTNIPRHWPAKFYAVLTYPCLTALPPQLAELGVMLLPERDFLPLDYRAWEKMWQRLLAFREKVKQGGSIWLVTTYPSPPLRDFAAQKVNWLDEELKLRHKYRLPPFTLEALVAWRGSVRQKEKITRQAKYYLRLCRSRLENSPFSLTWYGPYTPLNIKKSHQPRILLRGSLRALQAAAACLPKEVIWDILPSNTVSS
jgi:primosomal protein N'